MFCPNCGKDCADSKFCSMCGTKIPDTEAMDAVWSVGMPCPHCGGTKLDGLNCAFCGSQLLLEPLQRFCREGTQERKNHGLSDINDYFDRYCPNRVAAIKALRANTGMGLIEAKSAIDQVFDERLGQLNNKSVSSAKKNLMGAIKAIKPEK